MPASPSRGLLVAFEGLDQSGKQTQAERLRERLAGEGHVVQLLSFPEYDTPIGAELTQALQGHRNYGPELMQLLYVANRYARKDDIDRARAAGTILICDRYIASSIAYGEAHGLDPMWLLDIQRHLPAPDLTLILDIAPEVSARRKTTDRDKYERDLSLLARVRDSYLRQAGDGWVRIDGDRERDVVAREVYDAIARAMAR